MNELVKFIYRFRGYLADPRENGVAILVSTGLLLVVAAVVAVLAMWLRFQFTKKKQRMIARQRQLERPPQLDEPGLDQRTKEASAVDSRAAAVKNRRRSRLLIIAGLLIFAALVVAANIVPRYTLGKTSYCGNCHAMKAAVRSWRASKHARVACQACHEQPGVTGVLLSQAQGLSNISLASIYWRRQRPLVLKTPVTPSCLSCHQDIGKTIIKFKDTLKISHREFINSMGCETCHPSAGHAGKKLKFRLMNVCVGCHIKQQAGVACAVCHLPAPKWSKRRLEKYAKVKTRFSVSCKKCHETEMKCTQCHQQPQAAPTDE